MRWPWVSYKKYKELLNEQAALQVSFGELTDKLRVGRVLNNQQRQEINFLKQRGFNIALPGARGKDLFEIGVTQGFSPSTLREVFKNKSILVNISESITRDLIQQLSVYAK